MRADLGLTDAEAALFGRLPPAHIANLHRDALRFIDNAATLYVHTIIIMTSSWGSACVLWCCCHAKYTSAPYGVDLLTTSDPRHLDVCCRAGNDAAKAKAERARLLETMKKSLSIFASKVKLT